MNHYSVGKLSFPGVEEFILWILMMVLVKGSFAETYSASFREVLQLFGAL